MRSFIICLVAFVFLASAEANAFMGLFGDSMEAVTAKDGAITLNTKGIGNGQSKHYKYTKGSTTIRFFLLRDNQGTLRAALDACEVCWRSDKGYQLDGNAMVCVNCGMRFALNRIGEVRGGCNPHPIAFTHEGETFTVTEQELLAGSRYFPGNK